MEQELATAIVRQGTAITALGGAIAGSIPVLLAVPAAIYYSILIIEKITGKKMAELLGMK